METSLPSYRDQSVSVPLHGPSGRMMDAYLAAPSTPGVHPGLIVIHELYGLDENMREIARRFAHIGYTALAVDLFSIGNRVSCMLRIIYGMMIRPIDNGIVGNLRSSLEFLGNQTGVDRQRLGVVGFCMGGTYALQLACTGEKLQAASVFYGQNPRPLEAVARACPIVGSYPEKDFTARAARLLEPTLEKYKIPHDIKIYPNARHSFFNDRRPSFNPDASADAWLRMTSFFEKYLSPNRS